MLSVPGKGATFAGKSGSTLSETECKSRGRMKRRERREGIGREKEGKGREIERASLSPPGWEHRIRMTVWTHGAWKRQLDGINRCHREPHWFFYNSFLLFFALQIFAYEKAAYHLSHFLLFFKTQNFLASNIHTQKKNNTHTHTPFRIFLSSCPC